MDEDSPTQSNPVDRRAALKKAAAAAGIVAWATPTVQALTPGVAHALITNCFPTGTFILLSTGKECTLAEAQLGIKIDPECCNEATVFAGAVTVGCGSTCSPATTTITDVTAAVYKKGCEGEIAGFPQGFPICLAGATNVEVTSSVTCADNSMWTCTSSIKCNAGATAGITCTKVS